MDLNWLWIVPVLGLLVLVHEAGLFFTARAFGIGVEEFGIGLPPRAFAIRRNGIDWRKAQHAEGEHRNGLPHDLFLIRCEMDAS